MRPRLFFATLLALAPTPALADVTVHYLAGGKPLTVEVDDGGDARIDVGGKFSIIRHAGVEYVVVPDKDGPKVFKLDEMMDLVKGFIPPMKDPDAANARFVVIAGAAATVAGKPGAIWLVDLSEGPKDGKKRQIEMVMSSDPMLAPVGTVFGSTAQKALGFFGQMFPPETGFSAAFTEVFAKGAPLRITPIEANAAKPQGAILEFQSLDTAEIDAKRFELPAPVTSASEIMSALGSMGSQNKGPGPIENLP